MKNTEFEQNFKMIMVSLIQKYRIQTKFQNDYGTRWLTLSPPPGIRESRY